MNGRILRETQGDAIVPVTGHGGIFGAPLPQKAGNAGAKAGALFHFPGQFRQRPAHLPPPVFIALIQQGDLFPDAAKQRFLPLYPGRLQQRRVGLTGKGRAVQQVELHLFALRDLRQGRVRVHQRLQQGIVLPTAELAGQMLSRQPQPRLLTAQPVNGQYPGAKLAHRLFLPRVQPLPPAFPALQAFPNHSVQQGAERRFRRIERAVGGCVLVQGSQQPEPGNQHGDHPLVQIAAGVQKAAFFPVVPADGGGQQSAQVAQIGGGHQHHGMGQQA